MRRATPLFFGTALSVIDSASGLRDRFVWRGSYGSWSPKGLPFGSVPEMESTVIVSIR